MTKYTVAIKGEGDASAQSTENLDDALDWFTNAATEVMDDESDIEAATLTVDGVTCGVIMRDGVPPTGGGEVIQMKAA